MFQRTFLQVFLHFFKESFPQQERWYLSFDDIAGVEIDRVAQVVNGHTSAVMY